MVQSWFCDDDDTLRRYEHSPHLHGLRNGDVPPPGCMLQTTVLRVAAKLALTQVLHPQSKVFWSVWVRLTTVCTSGQANVPTGPAGRYRLIWDSSMAQKSRGDNVSSGSETENVKIVIFKQNSAQLYTPRLNLELISCVPWLLCWTPYFPYILPTSQSTHCIETCPLTSRIRLQFQSLVRTLFQCSGTLAFKKWCLISDVNLSAFHSQHQFLLGLFTAIQKTPLVFSPPEGTYIP